VIACSALKRTYRDRLRTQAPDALFILLEADRTLLEQRLSNRSGHYMPVSLIRSQLRALEPLGDDELGCRLDAAVPLEELVRAAAAWIEQQRLAVAASAGV
jgi:gluconokinase